MGTRTQSGLLSGVVAPSVNRGAFRRMDLAKQSRPTWSLILSDTNLGCQGEGPVADGAPRAQVILYSSCKGLSKASFNRTRLLSLLSQLLDSNWSET